MKIIKLYNTVKYLKFSQICAQILHRLHRLRPVNKRLYANEEIAYVPLDFVIPEIDTDESWQSRFAPNELLQNILTLLNTSRQYDFKTWEKVLQPHLLNYNLQYLEFLLAFAVEAHKNQDPAYIAKLEEILDGWFENGQKQEDAIEPYTISMRIVNLLAICSLFEYKAPFTSKLIANIYAQFCYLKKNTEKHLLGNHYLENLKALLLCSLFFNDDASVCKYFKKFVKQLDEQILSDGMHFELSPMYHKIMFENVIRVAFGLKQAGKQEYLIFIPWLQKMLDAAYSLEFGMGRTPLFNDSGDNVSKSLFALCQAAEKQFGLKPKKKDSFLQAGYFKLYDEDISMLFDAGKIGPDYLPGHAHCDCLSFELSKSNKPLFVNCGTYQYQDRFRTFFRSTAAHNTVRIGCHEQSECWAEHRVARRIKNVQCVMKNNSILGSYVNYYGEKHERVLTLSNMELSVLDSVKTKTVQPVHSYLHIAPEYKIFTENGIEICDTSGKEVCKILPHNSLFTLHVDDELCNYAAEFGKIEKAKCIEFYWQSDAVQHGYNIKFTKKG